MPIDERLVDAATPLARALRPPEDIRRAHRVDRAIDTQGRVKLEDRDFLPLRSPDGSLWRIRVSNTGTLTATKVTP